MNNNKEKLKRLVKYKQSIENSISSPIPTKHLNHPQTYKRFLENELSAVSAKIEELKVL